MKYLPPTIIIRHQKENLKKCSLRGLESRCDFEFFRYPLKTPLSCENFILLAVDAPVELSRADHDTGLLLLDATWRYAKKMEENLNLPSSVQKRGLPKALKTAYPRTQTDCPDPTAGLASIEALYCAYLMMGRSTEGLLDHYYWKDSFLEKNKPFLLEYGNEN
ncbi:MAG: hypothetical protein S4CHLAM123_05550 [Chlamydiales bacterium]|nr:hypothetical protein [Chlamydiales bacterium]